MIRSIQEPCLYLSISPTPHHLLHLPQTRKPTKSRETEEGTKERRNGSPLATQSPPFDSRSITNLDLNYYRTPDLETKFAAMDRSVVEFFEDVFGQSS